MKVHPIEEESYRILHGRIDLTSWPEGPAAVAARVVHATAEPSLVELLVVDERAVAAGVAALAAGAPVLCDVEMVRSGIPSVRATSAIAEAALDDDSARARGFVSRTASGMAALAARHPDGAVVVVGCAPTALEEVARLVADGSLRPALVVGTPVGFVGAAEAKEQLLEVAASADVPVIALRGERGGAAVAAAIVNALARRALEARRAGEARAPGCLFIGHGTRSAAGEDEVRAFVEAAALGRPDVETGAGYIEFVEPGLDEALDELVSRGADRVVAVPLVLLGAGHMKDDGPAALARARARHRGVSFTYARDLGVHPDVLAVVADRALECAQARLAGTPDALVVVGRGSTDPDANADLAKAARLLADGRGLALPVPGHDGPDPTAAREAMPLGLVVSAFVSLARPSVTDALDQCAALGARSMVVVPYFLFGGLLVERIRTQVDRWLAEHPSHAAVTSEHMGLDARLVGLAWHRYDEACGDRARMNCDGCVYRAPLPGYERRVGTPPFG